MKMVLFLVLIFSSPFCFAHKYSPAVLIIDMQLSFFDRSNNGNSKELNDLDISIYKLIDWAQKKSIPIIIVEYELESAEFWT